MRVDLTGQKFGRLTVVGLYGKSKSGQTKWNCNCECGAHRVVMFSNLRKGTTKSCGCLKTELERKRTITHGLSKTREYKIWNGIHRRCTTGTTDSYPRYGGRGIKVCERWFSVENFIADMGTAPSPKHSIDRIDNDRGYEPGNCRWATPMEQRHNRRSVDDIARERDELREQNAKLIAEVERLRAKLKPTRTMGRNVNDDLDELAALAGEGDE